ncbi:MAG: hypothetical protein A2487_16655 [Candidatus Raymondbacteria bacterium RifOxyC12_full_50_8]|nr:MAG: hypothetical protein A2350_13750 [Candidatus Raymondbacteria bacterium RifOxyB12_full_50_8]OGJ94413.1 MAG: hypothetical protein A2487_16655 [Candidatus Raymondbacteria bacterium RifOxyC12_full_50_8]
MKPKVLIFVVAYNAESHIESVLSRIPAVLKDKEKYDTHVLIIDDASKDNTVEVSNSYKIQNSTLPLEIFKNPVNQGYGGNQKIGFHYAIKNDFDVVALLHGDGQYAPECLPDLLEPIICGDADVVFGSRMLNKKSAIAGKMPLYKFIGNIILTKVQNLLLKSNLSEFHSGYRIYSVMALKRIPFQYNSNGFDFDTDIIIQLIDNSLRIKEIPIPTYYGNEICRVNGMRYAFDVVKTTLLSRVQKKANLYYDPKFDYFTDNAIYGSKIGYDSSHQFAINVVAEGATVLDIGCGPGVIARALALKNCHVHGVDIKIQSEAKTVCKSTQEIDLDSGSIQFNEKSLNNVLMLDIIEHLQSPESFLLRLRESLSRYSPKFIITTGNVAFIIVRFSLFLGLFNYGKKGILDLTHKRLSTFYSLKRLLVNSGYIIEEIKGIPVPFPLVFGQGKISSFLLFLNNVVIRVLPGLFSYQIAIVARPSPSLNLLLENAIQLGDVEKNNYLKTRI